MSKAAEAFGDEFPQFNDKEGWGEGRLRNSSSVRFGGHW